MKEAALLVEAKLRALRFFLRQGTAAEAALRRSQDDEDQGSQLTIGDGRLKCEKTSSCLRSEAVIQSHEAVRHVRNFMIAVIRNCLSDEAVARDLDSTAGGHSLKSHSVEAATCLVQSSGQIQHGQAQGNDNN